MSKMQYHTQLKPNGTKGLKGEKVQHEEYRRNDYPCHLHLVPFVSEKPYQPSLAAF